MVRVYGSVLLWLGRELLLVLQGLYVWEQLNLSYYVRAWSIAPPCLPTLQFRQTSTAPTKIVLPQSLGYQWTTAAGDISRPPGKMGGRSSLLYLRLHRVWEGLLEGGRAMRLLPGACSWDWWLTYILHYTYACMACLFLESSRLQMSRIVRPEFISVSCQRVFRHFVWSNLRRGKIGSGKEWRWPGREWLGLDPLFELPMYFRKLQIFILLSNSY